ncbi:MAG: hypothetical protein K6U78_18785 [Anaerolineae bacterium]|nr:hypothetical protein [Anaerolineae bacterium]
MVAGFRADETLVWYLSADEMYQFDPAARLRRAFVAGRLYRAQGTTLARLTRVRTAESTVLQRVDLAESELLAFQQGVRRAVAPLLTALEEGALRVLRRSPPGDDQLEADLRARLRQVVAASEWIAPPIARRH